MPGGHSLARHYTPTCRVVTLLQGIVLPFLECWRLQPRNRLKVCPVPLDVPCCHCRTAAPNAANPFMVGCSVEGTPAGGSGTTGSVGPCPAAGGEGMLAAASGSDVSPTPTGARKLGAFCVVAGAGGAAGGWAMPLLVSHAVNSSGLAGRASGARPCVLTASDKLFMMKSLWALFCTMATARLFSKMNANKDLPEQG